mgnify:CR=1 FL=1
MKQPSKGFVMVASKRVAFYYSACNLMECIKDYMPDANVTIPDNIIHCMKYIDINTSTAFDVFIILLF